METARYTAVETGEPIDGVRLAELASGEETSMQRFEIEPGTTVPEHSHPHEQTGFLSEGRLRFVSGGEPFVVEAGDSFTIPGGEPHSVTNEGDDVAVGVDVFSPPRADPDWVE